MDAFSEFVVPYSSICTNFWLGDAEISTKSDLLPDWAVALYRTVALGFSLYTLFRYSLEKKITFEYFTIWTLAGVCCAFFLGACSATTHSLTLRSFTSLFYHVFASASLVATVFFWWLIYDDAGIYWHQLYPHGIALGLMLIDIVLISRMEFRPWYIFVLVLYFITYLGFMFIRLAVTKEYTYKFLDHRVNSPRSLVAYYCAITFGAIACGLLMLLLSRIPRLFHKEQKHHHHHHQTQQEVQQYESKLMELDE